MTASLPAFAFFLSVFQGFAADSDLDKVRNRVVGILLGLLVTELVFHHIWPERATIPNGGITNNLASQTS